MQIDELLKFMVRQEASDLHLKPMRPPLLRIKGKLLPLKSEPIAPEVLRDMIYRILTDKQRAQLEEHLFLDFGYSLQGVSRFRCSIYHQRGTVAAVARRVPFQFPSLEEWGLPDVLKELAQLPQGLVLITGPTGSGKSSTLAAIVKEIVDTRLVHVVTVEDPIEFLLGDNLGSVSQREVGMDTRTFADALRNALRQDPDVIMVGEMRDAETIGTVLTAAETGHLVLSTLHTNGAAQTIDRIVDAFQERQHRQIRQQLAQVLEAVVSLQLVEKSDGSGLVAAVEIMRRNPRISKLIGEGTMTELDEEIEKSVSFEKMQSMNQSLIALVLNGVITREVALARSPSPGDLDLGLRRFLQQTQGASGYEDKEMATTHADFSKVLELQEIRRLYDELQERYRQEMADKDALIASLQDDLASRGGAEAGVSAAQRGLQEERDRLAQQLSFQKQDYEAKIEKLQLRIKELTAPVPETGRSGIFRR